LQDDPFEHFFDEGLITDIIRPVKSGKEASVHLCRANPSTTGEHLAALKIYHARKRRNFKDTSRYVQGRVLSESMQRGIARKGRAGRALEMGLWIEHEWAALGWLHRNGVRVPRPLARSDAAILMGWIGDADDPAPQLRSLHIDASEGQELHRELFRQIRLMLHANVIHADLSAYNVLVWDGEPWIIDVPQSVDPRENRQARELLARDVDRICGAFARSGVASDPARIAADLWNGWLFADLIPAELQEFL